MMRAVIALTVLIAAVFCLAPPLAAQVGFDRRGNDYHYDLIFARQLEGLGQPGDVIVGLSTSGSSANVLAGLRKARQMKLTTLGFTGESGGRMREACDICIRVPSTTTARIQEAHLFIGHTWCEYIEDAIAQSE